VLYQSSNGKKKKKKDYMRLNYFSISFRYLSYAGKCSRLPVGAVRVSKVNLALTGSATNRTCDPNHANASSPTSGSLSTYQLHSAQNISPNTNCSKIKI
jgi:hypothetical protein